MVPTIAKLSLPTTENGYPSSPDVSLQRQKTDTNREAMNLPAQEVSTRENLHKDVQVTMTEEEYRRYRIHGQYNEFYRQTVALTSDMAHVLQAVQEMVSAQFKVYNSKFTTIEELVSSLATQ